MLGLVFTSLIEMMEEKFSYDFADEVLEEAKLKNDGAYTAVGYYDFNELVKIASLVSTKTNTPMPALLTAFGEYLMDDIADGHPHIVKDYASLFDMLTRLDAEIHVRVRQLYENANLPHFSIGEKTDTTIELQYSSERRLEHLAHGLLNGASTLFNEPIEVEIIETPEEDYDVLIKVTKVAP
jgi:hypothetical protein